MHESHDASVLTSNQAIKFINTHRKNKIASHGLKSEDKGIICQEWLLAFVVLGPRVDSGISLSLLRQLP